MGAPPPQINAGSPSLPPLGGSLLPGLQPLICLSTLALATPHLCPLPKTGQSQGQQCAGISTLDCVERVLWAGTFVLVSLSLCFQCNRISMNKHQTWNTVQASPVSPIFVPSSSSWGLKRPLQHLKALCTEFCFQFSDPCCPCIRDSVLCWTTGEAKGQPKRCSH